MNKIVKKFATVGVTVATAVSLAGMGTMPIAGAQTIADLQAQIIALQAQLAALTGGDISTTCYVWNGNLTVGSTGPDVTTLQNYLTGTGHFTFSGGATGYFGPITQAAVASWQASYGISPAVGYFGPISQAKYTSLCGATTTPPADDTDDDGDADEDADDLQGGEGLFRNFQALGSPSSETVNQGATKKVFGFEYEADDSDLRIERVRVRFTTANDEKRPYRVFESVALYHGSDKVAEMDADSSGDWSKSGDNYDMTFTGLSEITRDGDNSEWYVEVTAKSIFPTAADADVWTVSLQVDSVRAVDAAGLNLNGPSSIVSQTFTLDTASVGELDVALADGENDARIVEVSSTTETSNVTLLTFEMDMSDGDGTITDLAVNLDNGASSTGDVGDILASVSLYRGTTLVKTKSIASTATATTVTFDDIDQDVDTGTETWSVKGKVKKIDGTLFAEGDIVVADIDDADITAEDINGDSITVNADITGGNVAFYSNGIAVTYVSSTATKTVDGSPTADDQGTFEVIFDVRAFGSDIWLPDGATASSTPGVGANFGAGYSVTDGTLTTTVSGTLTGGTAGSNSSLKVAKNTTKQFKLTVAVTADTGTADFVEVDLTGILWSTTDKSTGTNLYNFNLDEFDAGPLNLIAR